jgi:transcription initiation factor TFIIE subunit alpha
MKEDLLKILKKIISGIAGSDAEKIADLLYNKKNVNEFLIAKKLNLTINQTRNILYKLADHGLVTFVRKKDKKKGGWYIYFWTLETEKSLSKFLESTQEETAKLKDELKSRENERFYMCPECEAEYAEEPSLLNNFTCPECGEILQIKESEIALRNLKNEIQKLEKIGEQLTAEIKTIKEREEKLKQKRLKEEQKQKELEKKKKAAARKRAKAKEQKKNPKKTPKKEPKKKSHKRNLKKKISKKKKK